MFQSVINQPVVSAGRFGTGVWVSLAVLEALTSRHYRPVTFQGQPVSVSYAFQVKLKLP